VIPVFLGRRVLLVGICLNQTGVRRKALTADQPIRDTPRDRRLKQFAQQIAVAETAMSVLGKCRVVWHAISQIETTKPAICQVQMHLFTEPPLRSNAKATTHQKHPDQKLRVNRRTACMTVEI